MSRLRKNMVFEVIRTGPKTASEVKNALAKDYKEFMTAPQAYHYIRELAASGLVRKHTETKGPRGGQRWEEVK